ncbi:MAG: tryptophan synthase subunit alpha [Chitinophagaceae bacterium]
MSALNELFQKKSRNVLNVYCTAGFPDFESTIHIMEALQDSGADIIELGMPYSDPLADGEVIQESSSKALKNGMSIEKLFEQLEHMKKRIRIPVILMGYMNPVLQYGFEKFCADAARVGISGLILPDLPEIEFEREYGKIIQKHGLDFIFLVTPETSEQRVKRLDQLSSGFLYAVSSSSTTGKDSKMENLETYIRKLLSYGLKNPVLIGFGIKDKSSFNAACQFANGAIIGTAFIKALSQSEDVKKTTATFIKSILD